MPASKVHHYLVSLVRCGVIQQTTDGNYNLGTFALQIGLSALQRLEPIELATKAAKELRNETGEATFISVWGSHGATIIGYIEGNKPLTVEVRAGHVFPLANSVTDKVFVSWGSRNLVGPLLSLENINQKRINRIREQTRKANLGHAEGGLLPRISALTVPVFDMNARLALVITQLGWTGKFDSNLDGQIAKALIRASRQLSADLGYESEQFPSEQPSHL